MQIGCSHVCVCVRALQASRHARVGMIRATPSCGNCGSLRWTCVLSACLVTGQRVAVSGSGNRYVYLCVARREGGGVFDVGFMHGTHVTMSHHGV